MTQAQERRADGQGRLAVETLVEVVGNEPGIPAFEAESVDVSSRGMHLRTAYLPDEGAPLVCRFEEQGREIVVEGVVAWRREGARGGEFGVEFTALDSRSVDALRELCEGAEKPSSAEKPAAAAAEPPHDAGAKVRLHIDGLGSPMKARVRSGDPHRVQVGSNLEFLRVGRRLEIEDLEHGGRRTAHIDSVNVAIDPGSQVPQLVVALRYEGVEESTPAPSVADLSGDAQPRTLRIAGDDVSLEPAKPRRDHQIEDEGDREVEALRGKLGVAATHAGEAAVTAGKHMAAFSSTAALNFSGFLRRAGSKLTELTQRENKPQRRTTAPAPTGPVSLEGQRLRPQSAERKAEPETNPAGGVAAAQSAWRNLPKKKKTIMASAGAAIMLLTIVALATKHGAPPPGADAKAVAEPAVVGAVAAAAATSSVAAAAALPPPSALTEANGVVSADVPLFGATPMATMEPAPLAPPPGTDSVEAAERADAKASVAAPANDESFPGDEENDKAGKHKDSGKKPEDVAPWGRGKVTTPVIYRLRLDSAGEALQGSLQPTGFTIVVPKRKVMEQGSSIAKRDPRIAHVRTVNTPNGAQVTFQFKDGVPAYRARLRRDYVEFLIGSAEPKKEDVKKPEPAAAAKTKSKPATKPKH
jgi:hypothetical protein